MLTDDEKNKNKITRKDMLELYITGLDIYDKEKRKADYEIRTSRKDIEPFFTSNIFVEIHRYRPKYITIDPYCMDGNKVALYINALTNEDYIHEPRKALEIPNRKHGWVNDILHFKRKY